MTQHHASVRVGLVGRGIARSRTPVMHMAEAENQGFTLVYELIDVDARPVHRQNLDDILSEMEAAGFRGLNITYPFKTEVVPLLNELSEDAEAIGAVNTVIFENGQRCGHNTDCSGFQSSFLDFTEGQLTKSVVLLGAGGAGAAVARALANSGVWQLRLFDTDRRKAEQLVNNLKEHCPALSVQSLDELNEHTLRGAEGVVNASPVGMDKMPGLPLAREMMHPKLWVADIIYFPLETELLKQARNLGCRTFSGAGMAVAQAVDAFKLFTGRKADSRRMKAAFDAFD